MAFFFLAGGDSCLPVSMMERGKVLLIDKVVPWNIPSKCVLIACAVERLFCSSLLTFRHFQRLFFTDHLTNLNHCRNERRKGNDIIRYIDGMSLTDAPLKRQRMEDLSNTQMDVEMVPGGTTLVIPMSDREIAPSLSVGLYLNESCTYYYFLHHLPFIFIRMKLS